MNSLESLLRAAPPSLPQALHSPAESSIARLFVDLPIVLRDAGIEHAFLRGLERYPARRPGADVDVLVRPADLPRAVESVSSACRELGATRWGLHAGPALRQLHLYGVDGDGNHEFLSIDLHAAETCFGVPLFTAAELLAEVDPDAGSVGGRASRPRRLRASVSAVVNFLPSYLASGVPDVERLAKLARAIDAEPGRTEHLLREALGGDCGAFVESARAHDVGALAAAAPRLRRRALGRAIRRSPRRALGGVLACAWAARIAPLWRPRGRFVALLGTDGSGKSTLAEALADRLRPAFRSAESGIWHLRPGLLPQLDRVVHFGRATQGPDDWARPHRARPSGRLVSNLRVLWYAADYFAGYVARVLPRRRRNSLVVFDRYFHDYLVDPERCRVRRGTLAARLFSALVPRPDAILVVTAPLEAVRARKQELAPEETARQLAAYENLAARGGRFHLVRNGGSLERSVQDALHALFPPRTRTRREGVAA